MSLRIARTARADESRLHRLGKICTDLGWQFWKANSVQTSPATGGMGTVNSDALSALFRWAA